MSAHSLEPLRPWKAEQLGGGYALSSWVERTAVEAADAVIAVSAGMRDDVLRATRASTRSGCRWSTTASTPGVPARPRHRRPRADGVDPDRPSVLFVGRITRQKGLPHLLRAARSSIPEVQVVLCAGARTPRRSAPRSRVSTPCGPARDGVVWIEEMLPKPEVVQLLTHATAFVCPSVYEPLGIVNLEAMACETPVVATATSAASPRWSPTARPGCSSRSSR